jgi:hypothetical protein
MLHFGFKRKRDKTKPERSVTYVKVNIVETNAGA